MPHTTDKQSLTKTIIRLSSQLLSVVKLSGNPIIKHLNVQLKIEKQTKPVLTNEAIKPKLKRSSHPIGHEIMHLYAVKQMDGQTLKINLYLKSHLKHFLRQVHERMSFQIRFPTKFVTKNREITVI